MSFFDEQDDPFESIVREFFGEKTIRRHTPEDFIQGEEDERTIDFVEMGKHVFLVFEILGYEKRDIEIKVDKKQIEIIVRKKTFEDVQQYLARRLGKGVYFKKNLPNFINFKKFNYTFKNGILEVVFEKR